MKEWLKKYWPVLALAVGGVIVLIYLKSRQASETTGTNQLAATLPLWGSGGGGGVVFEPTPDTPPDITRPNPPPQEFPPWPTVPPLPPGEIVLGDPAEPIYGPPVPLPGGGWSLPVTYPTDGYTDSVLTVSPMSEAVHSGYEIK
jgi:hypothetical protein